MSGSFLWDTKAVKCLRDGRPWTSSEAKVCGLIWGSTLEPLTILATRVEKVRAAVEYIMKNLPR
jgi:hypothetical protein